MYLDIVCVEGGFPQIQLHTFFDSKQYCIVFTINNNCKKQQSIDVTVISLSHDSFYSVLIKIWID